MNPNMLEVFDRSTRRGTLVPMLKNIYTLIASNTPSTENMILWSHKMRKNLLDINWRFLTVMSGNDIVGLLFYRYDGNSIYIEEMQVARAYSNDPQVVESLLKKLELDPGVKDAIFYANDRMKQEVNKEILASVGFKEEIDGGWECLGNFSETNNTLKLRYIR